MKILVPIKRVVDHNVKIRVSVDQKSVDLTNVKMAVNPFCEIAVEQAVRMKESGICNEVVVVSVGEKVCQEQIRSALALGADRGIHIEHANGADSLIVARLLHALIEKEQPDLVLMGKQSIDSDNNQCAQMLAALCGWPQGTFASAISLENGIAEVTREIDGGLQTLALTLPAVISTDLRLNEPRYASLPNIMKAKRKPLEVIAAEDLCKALDSNIEVLEVIEPQSRQGGQKVESVDELLAKLKQEAKVI